MSLVVQPCNIGRMTNITHGMHYRLAPSKDLPSTFRLCIGPDRPDRLAQQQLRVTGDDEVTQLANLLITHPGVKAPSVLVEVRDADEYVWRFTEYAPLGVFNQRLAHTLPAEFSRHAKQLDIANERAVHAYHQKPGPLSRHLCHIPFARPIGE